jgi:hypothetical protein
LKKAKEDVMHKDPNIFLTFFDVKQKMEIRRKWEIFLKKKLFISFSLQC